MDMEPVDGYDVGCLGTAVIIVVMIIAIITTLPDLIMDVLKGLGHPDLDELVDDDPYAERIR